jgi:hypothetical protein
MPTLGKRATSKRGALWEATITEILAGYYQPDGHGRKKPESLYGSLKMWGHLQREGTPAGNALKKSFDAQCFYCAKRIAIDVDHVLPWSRTHIDSLANLVPACRTCNGDKSGLLPAPNHVEAALMRDHSKLHAIAENLICLQSTTMSV